MLAVLVLVLTSCTGDDPDASPQEPATSEARESPSPSESPSESASPTPSESPAPSSSASPAAEALPEPPHRVSLPTLMREEFRGGRIRMLRKVLATDAYTRHEITYPSGDLTVSGVLLRPRGKGPFPALVLNHGYIEPSIYVTGQGMMREQDYLARAGFVVLHTDYRGHAAGDPVPDRSRETRLGYTRDSLNAVASLKRLRYVDPERVGMVGRSMGGAVTYNALVAKPGMVKAGVVFAPVSSDFVDNFNRWTVRERPSAAQATYQRWGTPREEPAFYQGLSARTYFDRITEPLLIHHGTSDDSCPIRWSRESLRLLERAGVDARLWVYEGEEHAFGPQWPLSMERTVRFLRRQLNG